MARALIVDESGSIVRQLRGAPDVLALQVGPGETLFAVIEETDSGTLDDGKIVVDDQGELAIAAGADLDHDLPDLMLAYVPT